MNWLYYLLEANLYLAAFYIMYKLLLQRSTFYNSNRYFLILSIAAAFTVPLMQLSFLKPPLILEDDSTTYEIPLETFEIATVAKAPVLTIQDYVLYGYLALALFLSLKFIISILKIVKIYLRSNKRKLNNYTLVELASEHSAFSFFNILFIHPDMAKSSAVLKHEIIHIKQKHSWDIILLELLKICCWFNPVVYLMKKDLTLLHEYIADEQTTATNISKHEYAMFLIENSMAAYSSSIVNQLFNQSILKSRINMLNKEKTANWARLKYLLAAPLGVGLLCASTLSFSKNYGYLEIGEQKQVQQKNPKAKQEKPVYYPEHRYDEKNNFISLEKRAIIVNGKVVADKNKFFGVAEADEIKYLNSAEATKKYGSKIGKNGAVVITGKNLVGTPPPPMMPLATPASPPKVKKDQIKFPTTYYPKYKHDKDGNYISLEERLIVVNGKIIADKNKYHGTAEADKIIFLNRKDAIKKYGSEEGKNGAIEIYGEKAVFTYPPPIVKPDKKAAKSDKAKLAKEIELAELSLIESKKLEEIEVIPTKHYEGVEIKEAATTPKVELLKIVPTKKVQSLKLTPKATENKTGALKPAKTNITTVKASMQKTNSPYSKAWTLYKPKVEQNKKDNC